MPALPDRKHRLPLRTGGARFDGRSVARGESEYEVWRQAMPWQMYTAPRYPELIARPATVAAVADVIRAAQRKGHPVAIKSGGHNVSAAFLRDGGVLLDLGELQGVEVDSAAGTAWVEPALWSHGLLGAIAPHGYAFPLAHCATVPMGGYLLGGGLGYNHDNWGTLACHSILAAEVVLANGETVIASPDSEPDLYWAVRGAGTGFFGVVTRYKIQLYRGTRSGYGDCLFVSSGPPHGGHRHAAGLGRQPAPGHGTDDVVGPQPRDAGGCHGS